MNTAALVALAAALAVTATAQEARRTIDPLAIYGNWLGSPGAAPTDCKADGYVIAFGSTDGKAFMMTVQNRVGGVAPLIGVETQYAVIPPPPTAPARVEIFLHGEKGDLGIHVRTGSQIELVPAGPDNTYPATSLFLQRC